MVVVYEFTLEMVVATENLAWTGQGARFYSIQVV